MADNEVPDEPFVLRVVGGVDLIGVEQCEKLCRAEVFFRNNELLPEAAIIKTDESPRFFFMVELSLFLYPDRVHEPCLLSVRFIQVQPGSLELNTIVTPVWGMMMHWGAGQILQGQGRCDAAFLFTGIIATVFSYKCRCHIAWNRFRVFCFGCFETLPV
ncbi:hypothetical protein AWY79_08820 [Pseudodesulfovibrio indicus]|uniref:Uncharacterized protein n=1 Tax=Pseudodesulfovibrio indicus TaxID=1716143 RepID=A0ABM5YUV4_9BACT|nr:hypothetical protein AWY79_08820 [Pseudodesulfovibrio indicus]